MKTKLLVFLLPLFLFSCSNGKLQDIPARGDFAVLPEPASAERVANFAGGCFWSMQECMLSLKGVRMVISGYAGGNTSDPTYDKVLAGNTGHAEAVQVYYNPKVISFDKLAKAFFLAHDPTQLNGQGPDIGSDYRSIAFYRNEQEYRTLLNVINKIDDSGKYKDNIVTELKPLEVFHPAEMSHQDYYKRNPWDLYIRKVSKPKVLKLRHAIPTMIKSEYTE